MQNKITLHLTSSNKDDNPDYPICPVINGKNIILTGLNLSEWNTLTDILTIYELELRYCSELNWFPSISCLQVLSIESVPIRSIPTLPICTKMNLVTCSELTHIDIQPKLKSVYITSCPLLTDISGLVSCNRVQLSECPGVRDYLPICNCRELTLTDVNLMNYQWLDSFFRPSFSLVLATMFIPSAIGILPAFSYINELTFRNISLVSMSLPCHNIMNLSCFILKEIHDCVNIQRLTILDCHELIKVHDFCNIGKLKVYGFPKLVSWGKLMKVGHIKIWESRPLESALKEYELSPMSLSNITDVIKINY